MSIVDFLAYPGVSGPWLSPDGTRLIYVRSESDWKTNKQISHGNAVLSYQWSPDGQTIYFLADDTLTKEEESAKELNDDVYPQDEDYKQRHLWKVSIQDKEELRITGGDYSIMSYNISRDGQSVVLHRGPNPLFDFYKESDIRTYRTPRFGGSPWQKDAPIDVYWDHSPLKDISNVTTPTLVFVGRNDLRIPYSQSLELYRALRSLGVPTHLYVAPRESHGWRELRHRLYKINMGLEWFARYGLDKKYEWEKVEEPQEKNTP